MSSTGEGRDDWDPADTGAVPVGPEPEPTGVGGAGSGGWGEAPRTEPFAVAALVWALVSIVLPIVGTIVAFVLAARAADAIRRSRGTRSGTGLVTAARVIAGVVIVLWAIGLVLFVALRDGDSDDSNVAVPTQPSAASTTFPPSTASTLAPTTTPTTTPTTAAPVTTTQPIPPTTSIVPPPPTDPPTTVAPTQPTEPPTTEPPTTEPTSPPTTTVKPTVPTTPEQREEARIQTQLLKTTGNASRRIGPSNRGVPDAERIVVTYVPGQTLQVRWAINNGEAPLPVGEATCTSLPTTTTTLPDGDTTTTTSTTTTTMPSATTTTEDDALPPTPQLARREARNILNVLRTEIMQRRLDVEGVQLVGLYPIEGPEEGDVDVVQVFYSNSDVTGTWPAQQAFDAPPADQVQCLNPAFA